MLIIAKPVLAGAVHPGIAYSEGAMGVGLGGDLARVKVWGVQSPPDSSAVRRGAAYSEDGQEDESGAGGEHLIITAAGHDG